MIGCPIRTSPDLRLFAPTRGLSQLITSFIASMCLGILRTPLVALLKCSFLKMTWLLESLKKMIQFSNFPIVKKQKNIVELTGIEPMTSCVQNRRSPN